MHCKIGGAWAETDERVEGILSNGGCTLSVHAVKTAMLPHGTVEQLTPSEGRRRTPRTALVLPRAPREQDVQGSSSPTTG